MTYPWLMDHRDEFVSRFKAEKLPHALLFTGQPGVGKFELAMDLAAFLLCERQSRCGTCKGCQLFAAGSHPDVRVVELEEGAQQIKIEQIRSLIDWVNQTAQMNGAKISIISPAHKMNRNAANALLKVMEEPPLGNHLILLSDEPAVLLPTIRSRAQQLNLAPPSFEVGLSWLQQSEVQHPDWEMLLRLSSGSPLLALQRADDEFLPQRQLIAGVWRDLWFGARHVVELAEAMAKIDLVDVLQLALELLADVARYHATGDKNTIVNKDLSPFVEALAGTLSQKATLHYMSLIERDYRLAKGPQNPNAALLLEALMADCLEAPKGAAMVR